MTAVNRKKVTVGMNEGTDSPWILGAMFLPDGRLFLADFMKNRVKLLTSSFGHEGSVTLDMPFDIAVIKETTAIASAKASHLHYIHVVPKLQLESDIYVDNQCFGIDVYNDTIYLACHKRNEGQGHVRLLDIDGKLKGILGIVDEQNHNFMLNTPHYVRVSRTSGNIFVSDWKKDKVMCLQQGK